MLVADDYAISDGVSRGIEELAAASRLSATSAIVNLPAWSRHASRLANLRTQLAIGLHLNLTLGKPLDSISLTTPSGTFPTFQQILPKSLTGQLHATEIEAEIERQLHRFERDTGFAPDYVDGHQHVHVLPVVRGALLRTLKKRYPTRQILIRDPGDSTLAIVARGANIAKALIIANIARRFGAQARREGFATNDGFSGVSAFDETIDFTGELARFFSHPGPCHLVMCHPGYPDVELSSLDPVVARRRQELDVLMIAPGLDRAIWRVTRRPDGAVIWPDGAGKS